MAEEKKDAKVENTDMMKMSPEEMSAKMKEWMHSDKRKNKVMGNFFCAWLVNSVMAGIFGWFTWPSGNPDTGFVYAANQARRDAFAS